MNNEDTTADYLAEPDEKSTANTLDLWEGEPLAPLSLGMRQQWLAITESSDTPIFMSATLIYLLLIGQKAFVLAQMVGADMESAWNACRSAVLMQTADKMGARVKAFGFIDGMKTRAKQNECCRIAADILRRADASEPEDKAAPIATEEDEALKVGKGRGNLKKQRSPMKRSKSS